LVRLNGVEISHSRFQADAEPLIGAVEGALEDARAKQQRQREEEQRPGAKQREHEEAERLQAEQRAQKERLEVESRQREAQDRLATEKGSERHVQGPQAPLGSAGASSTLTCLSQDGSFSALRVKDCGGWPGAPLP